MSEMVERVARVLWQDHVRRLADDSKNAGYVPHGEDWKFYTDNARAAIAAMREPTEGIEGAGAWALTILHVAGRADMSEKDIDLSVIGCIWDAMIEECLEPGTSAAWGEEALK